MAKQSCARRLFVAALACVFVLSLAAWAAMLSNRLEPLRSLIAILLFAATLLPFALPGLALAQRDGSGLPACCRRDGAHHCAMSPGERERLVRASRRGGDSRHWRAPVERCPYCPASVATWHHGRAFAAPTAQAIFGELLSHPSGSVQTESKWRISRDRSRQKRGPPVGLSLS